MIDDVLACPSEMRSLRHRSHSSGAHLGRSSRPASALHLAEGKPRACGGGWSSREFVSLLSTTAQPSAACSCARADLPRARPLRHIRPHHTPQDRQLCVHRSRCPYEHRADAAYTRRYLKSDFIDCTSTPSHSINAGKAASSRLASPIHPNRTHHSPRYRSNEASHHNLISHHTTLETASTVPCACCPTKLDLIIPSPTRSPHLP